MKEKTNIAVKRIIKGVFIGSFLFLLPLGVWAQEQTKETEVDEIHFRRNSILVSDLEKSLSVYRDILGFEVAMIAESDKDSYAYEVFRIPKDATFRVASLNSADQSRIINLKEVSGVELPKPPSAPFVSAMLLKVENLEKVMSKIKALGLESTKAHTVNGKRLRYIEQSFIDYDGHLVALYQLL